VQEKRIAVVGAGPAGMMAAIRAVELGCNVTLIERNPILGKKLLLSGKGRCNLTNTSPLDLFLKRFSGKAEFLRDAFKKFFNRELMNFFQVRGVRLVIERQSRVFPAAGRSLSICEALKKELSVKGARLIFKSRVKDIIFRDKRIKGVLLEGNKVIAADKVILATGGVSYAFTGSSGDGIALAKRLGHKIAALRPGLVPLLVRQKYVLRLEGLSLKNIRLNFSADGRQIISEIGELIFTANGISGPLVLTLSGAIVDWLGEKKAVYVEIDLKPALSFEQLNSRLLREFRLNSKKSIRSVLALLLPKRMIDLFLEIAKINPQANVSHLTQDQRKRLVSLLKGFRLDIAGALDIEEAMVTRGGISLKDINPRTMESRLIKGLYFAGEMIDLAADTGGFNLQAAFSSGYLAGESAALN